MGERFRGRYKGWWRWNYLWMGIYFIAFGVYLIGMPKYIDDYWYLERFRGWFMNQGISDPEWGGNIFKAGVPWREILDTWEWHYANDTFRLGNIMVVPFLLLPKWVGSTIAYCFWIYAVTGGLRFAGINLGRSPLVPWALAAYYVLMPWRYYMGSLDYQFNYLIPSGLLVWLLVRLTAGKRGNSGRDIWTLLLGIVLGWWHEGFGVPGACCVFVLLLGGRFRSRAAWMALAGILVGLAFDMSSPGIRERARDSLGEVGVNIYTIIETLRSQWVFFIGVLLVAGGMSVRKTRIGLTGNTRLWGMLAGCLASLVLLIRIQGGDRVGWVCGLLSVPFCLGLIRLYWPRVSAGYRWAGGLAAGCIMSVVIAGLVMIDVAIFRVRALHSRVVREIALNPKPQAIFDDYKYMREQSPLMIGMPSWSFSGSGMRYLSQYFLGKGEGHRIYCVPRELERVTAESGSSVPGRGGFREYKGKYFAPYSGPLLGQKVMKIELDFGKGYTSAFCIAGVFESKADGKRYVFIDPDLGLYVTYFKEIKGLGNLKEP